MDTGEVHASPHDVPGCSEEPFPVAAIDLGALRKARAQRLGFNPLAHLRREAQARPARCGYPDASFSSAADISGNRTGAKNDAAIRGVLQQEPDRGRSG